MHNWMLKRPNLFSVKNVVKVKNAGYIHRPWIQSSIGLSPVASVSSSSSHNEFSEISSSLFISASLFSWGMEQSANSLLGLSLQDLQSCGKSTPTIWLESCKLVYMSIFWPVACKLHRQWHQNENPSWSEQVLESFTCNGTSLKSSSHCPFTVQEVIPSITQYALQFALKTHWLYAAYSWWFSNSTNHSLSCIRKPIKHTRSDLWHQSHQRDQLGCIAIFDNYHIVPSSLLG